MAPNRRDSEVVIEGARLIFRNFQGKKGVYNPNGDRMFHIMLDAETAAAMEKDGWHVLERESKYDDSEEPSYYHLKVKVSYNPRARPPQIFLITGKNRTSLGEDELEVLDWGEFVNVDLIIAPFDWDVNGKTGRSAYLRSLYAEIYVDPLMLKYGALDDIVPARAGNLEE